MSNEIKETLDGLGRAFEEFKKANDQRIEEIKKAGSATAETVEKVEKLNATIDSLKDRLEKAELKLDTPSNPRDGRKHTPEQEQHLKDFNTWLRNPKDPDAIRTMHEHSRRAKAVSVGTPADGGYAVPEILLRDIEKKLIDVSPFRSLVRVVQVANTDFRALVDVRGEDGGWVGEDAGSGNRSATNTPSLGQVQPTFGTLYAYPKATEESINDLFFDVGGWLVDNIVETFAKLEGEAIVSGNGSNKPTGFLNGVPVSTGDDASPARAFGTLQYVPTGAAGAFPNDRTGSPPGNPGDPLIDLVYSLKAGYRANARWVANKATLSTVRKFKDSEGNYLWAPGLVAGQPDRILGYAVAEMEAMPDIGSNTFPMAFGDFRRGYLLADVVGLRISVDDNITTPGQVKWYVRRRLGGKVLNCDAIKLLKAAAA